MENNYGELTDEQIVALARDGSREAEDYIIRKYSDVLRKKAGTYFIAGADRDDVIQEGMIGLFAAIRDYRSDRDAAFATFAELCIKRQILTAVKAAGRKKHQPLNQSVSLSWNSKSGGEDFLDSLTQDDNMNPEATVIMNDMFDVILNDSGQMFSKLELAVWREYIKGRSCEETAKIIGKSSKATDNALQRIKRKIINYVMS